MFRCNKKYYLLLLLVNRLRNKKLLWCIRPTRVNQFSRQLRRCNFDVLNIIFDYIGYEYLLDVFIEDINIYNIVETIDKKEGVIGLLMSELRKYPNYCFSYHKNEFRGDPKRHDDWGPNLFKNRNTESIDDVSGRIRVSKLISKNGKLWTQSFTLDNNKNLKKLYCITVSRIKSIFDEGSFQEKLDVLENVLNRFLKKNSKFRKLDDCMDFSNFRSNLLKFYRNTGEYQCGRRALELRKIL